MPKEGMAGSALFEAVARTAMRIEYAEQGFAGATLAKNDACSRQRPPIKGCNQPAGVYGALEKRLTHSPFTAAFAGSNPVRTTTLFRGHSFENLPS